jgi:hypothetical protein
LALTALSFTPCLPTLGLCSFLSPFRLGISTWKVRKLVLDGKLPCVADSANGPWLFDIHDSDAYIETNKHTM